MLRILQRRGRVKQNASGGTRLSSRSHVRPILDKNSQRTKLARTNDPTLKEERQERHHEDQEDRKDAGNNPLEYRNEVVTAACPGKNWPDGLYWQILSDKNNVPRKTTAKQTKRSGTSRPM